MMPSRRTVRECALFSTIAAVLLGYLFRDAILHGDVLGQADFLLTLVPWESHRPLGLRVHNPLLGDIPALTYPFLFHAREAVRSGELPLWASGIGAGQPFLAAYQTAVFSPFTLFDYALPFPQGLTADVAARLYVGGLGMFWFLRATPLSLGASLFGGVAFLLNPFSVVWLEHPLSAVAAFLPWLLHAVRGAIEHTSGRGAAGIAALTTLTLLAGHPETAFKVVLFAAIYALYRASRAPERRIGALVVVAAAFVLGTVIASVQIVPFLEYLRESRILTYRQEAARTFNYTEPAAFVTAFVPDFYGSPLKRRYLLDGTNYCEQQVYAGVITLVLAALGVAHRPQRSSVLFFGGAAMVSALIMYVPQAASLMTTALPPLKVAVISRFGLLFVTGLIVAAAIGLDAVLDARAWPLREGSWRPVVGAAAAAIAFSAIVAAFLIGQRAFLVDERHWSLTMRSVGYSAELLVASLLVVWLASRFRHTAMSAFAVGLVALDLLAFGDGFHALTPRQITFPDVAELSMIRADPDVVRVAGWNNAFLPNTSLVYGLQDYRSYDGIGVRRYNRLLDAGFHFNGSTHLLVSAATSPFLDLLNVKYVLTPQDVELPTDRFRLLSDGKTRVYRNERVQPRVTLVDSVAVRVADDALRAIRSGLDLSRTAIVDAPLAAAEQPEPASGDLGTVRISHYGNNRVTVETDADGRRLLLLRDVYYPGWVATIDGAAAPIRLANVAFRAVSVPAGRHRVEFVYRPDSFRYGLMGTFAGSAILGIMLAGPHVRRSRARPHQSDDNRLPLG
jgi:hypothetical protein